MFTGFKGEKGEYQVHRNLASGLWIYEIGGEENKGKGRDEQGGRKGDA